MGDNSSRPESAARNQVKPILWVTFIGSGVVPERVPLGTLSRALNAINQLAGGEHHAAKKGDLLDPGLFQLVGVRKGSARYAFGGTPAPDTFDRLRVVGTALDNPNAVEGIDFSLRALTDLSSVAARLRCQIVIARPREGGESVLARIGPDSARSLEDNLLISGDTSIFGQVKRVGGVTAMRCSLRLPSQGGLLYCRVANSALSRRLGKYLYKDVVVHGRATWMRSSWRIVRFMINGVDRAPGDDIADAFAQLREAGGSDWDDIEDPEAFLDIDRRDE